MNSIEAYAFRIVTYDVKRTTRSMLNGSAPDSLPVVNYPKGEESGSARPIVSMVASAASMTFKVGAWHNASAV